MKSFLEMKFALWHPIPISWTTTAFSYLKCNECKHNVVASPVKAAYLKGLGSCILIGLNSIINGRRFQETVSHTIKPLTSLTALSIVMMTLMATQLTSSHDERNVKDDFRDFNLFKMINVHEMCRLEETIVLSSLYLLFSLIYRWISQLYVCG